MPAARRGPTGGELSIRDSHGQKSERIMGHWLRAFWLWIFQNGSRTPVLINKTNQIIG